LCCTHLKLHQLSELIIQQSLIPQTVQQMIDLLIYVCHLLLHCHASGLPCLPALDSPEIDKELPFELSVVSWKFRVPPTCPRERVNPSSSTGGCQGLSATRLNVSIVGSETNAITPNTKLYDFMP